MMSFPLPSSPVAPSSDPHDLRGFTRRWRYRTTDAARQAAAGLGLPDRLLAVRGYGDPASIKRFCDPRLSDLHPPALLPGAVRAAERLAEAVRRRERIVIYGDYDVDGITATAILYHALKAADPDARISTYVPHRLEEGYGLNSEAIRQLAADGAGVIVSVDCGITAIHPARIARELGVDLIITDHHNLPAEGEPLPDAFAMVHPRLPESVYPFGELCGAGVAFKLAWQFAIVYSGNERVGTHLQKRLLDLLPLVALGTIADVVPLVDENRILAGFGLRGIKQTPFDGLRALIEASDLMNEKIDSESVGFILGPRLNACGRMGHAAEAIRMLTDAPPEEAARIAKNLAKLNQERQKTERAIAIEAEQLAIDRGMTGDDRRIIVLAHESWHQGVVGIVCSRLVEKFGRPAILMQRMDDLCKGSARSIEGYSISAALAACTAHLATHGGHDMAAGLSLTPNALDGFTEAITTHANEHIESSLLTPSLSLDADVTLGELTTDAVERLQRLSPFGRGNPKPLLRLRDVSVQGSPRAIGRNARHLSLSVAEEGGERTRVLRAVWWSAASFAADLPVGTRVDLAIEPKLNHWNGRTTVEAEIKDARRLPAS